MALILYALTALALLELAHRLIRPLSRWTAVILFLLPLAITGYALVANRVLAPVDLPYDFVPMNWLKAEYGIERVSTGIHTDVYLEFIPWRKATQWSLARGEWGLWNPFTYAGEPHLAGVQASVTWPLTWIACLLPVGLSFTFSASISLFVAALTAFLFARELGCRDTAALIAAAGWMFASSLVLFILVAMGVVWAWAPLVYAGVRRVTREPGWRAMLLLAFALTAILAAGHPESALYVVFTAMLYGVFELAMNRGTAVRAVAFALGGGAIALLLSAIHLLPFLEALPHTQEFVFRREAQNMAVGVPGGHVLARVAATFFPWLHGRGWKLATQAPPSFMTGAVGSILIGLAFYALWRVRSRHTWFFGGLFALTLLTGAEWKPLAKLLGSLPVFNIALNDRLATASAFCLVVLAAIGAEEICRRRGDRGAAWTLAAWLVVVAIGNAWLARTPLVTVEFAQFFGRYVMAAEIALLAAAAIVLMTGRAALRVLLALIILQRALSVSDVYKSFTQRQTYPPIPILEPLKNVHTPFRITGHGDTLPPATSTMYELEDIRGYSAMTFLRLRETFLLWGREQPVWFSRVDDLTRPFLSFLNVRYAITWDRDPPPPGWREVARMRGTILIENTRVLDRAFVPRSVRVGDSGELNLMHMALASDFGERAWIEDGGAAYERENGPGGLAIRRARLGYDIDADMQRDGWIVTSIAAWPGWRAYVDGKRIGTQIANHAFVSVHVPQGRHRVRLKYWPRSFAIGRTITAATLLAVIVLAVLLHRRESLLQRRDAALAPLSLGE